MEENTGREYWKRILEENTGSVPLWVECVFRRVFVFLLIACNVSIL